MRRSIATSLKLLFGLLLLGLLINAIGFGEFIAAMRTVALPIFFLSFLVEPLVQLFGGLIYKVLLIPMNHHITVLYAVRSASVAYAMGFLSPGRVSELSIIIPLREKGVPYGPGLAIAILDKIAAFIFLGVMGSLGILYFVGVSEFVIVATAALTITMIAYWFFGSYKIEDLMKTKVLKSKSDHIEGFAQTIRDYFGKHRMYLAAAVVLKALKWTMSYVAIYIIFLSMGYDLNIFAISLIFSAVVLISTVPITFSGIGVKEGAGALMYSAFLGVPPAIASNAMLLSTAKNFSLGIVYYLLSSSLIIKSRYAHLQEKKNHVSGKMRFKRLKELKDRLPRKRRT